jgi:prophage regulatory protein
MESIMREGKESVAVGHLRGEQRSQHSAEPHHPAATISSPMRRTIRRTELHKMVPLSGTTIYDLERRGEFPRRFNLTSRCVVWDLAEVEAWIEARRQVSDAAQMKRAPSPDVRQRKRRPVKAMLAS